MWVDDYENDTVDPQDGGEPIRIWWEDIRSREVREVVKRAYERGKAAKAQKHADALLDCHDRAEEADEKLQDWWPRLEAVLSAEFLEDLKDALQSIGYIQRVVVQAFDGVGNFMLAQNEREEREGGQQE
jgi:hypothetical protein